MRRTPRSADGMTSRTIAELSGVSQTTVSRVMRGDRYVSAATREKVLRVLRQTGYAPSAAARTMRTGSTGIIGVVVGYVTNTFYPELALALHAEISRRGRRMNLWIADESAGHEAGERAALTAVRERAVDGVVFTTVTSGSVALKEALERSAPVVLLNRTLDGIPADSVATDNAAGAEDVAAYFLAHSRRRIALIAGPREVSTSCEREDAFRAALREAGTPLGDEAVARCDFAYEGGRGAMTDLLRRCPDVDAVFCVNDLIAFGALDALRGRVPDEVWVVGFDGTTTAGWDAFSLTTVRQPIEQMAAVGIDFLLQRAEQGDGDGDGYRHERLRGELIVRASTDRESPRS
jgi:LacI family transcriptional regulator